MLPPDLHGRLSDLVRNLANVFGKPTQDGSHGTFRQLERTQIRIEVTITGTVSDDHPGRLPPVEYIVEAVDPEIKTWLDRCSKLIAEAIPEVIYTDKVFYRIYE